MKESFASSTIGSFVIEEEQTGHLLVDATSFFVKDAHGAADKIKSMRQGTYSFNEPRSAMYFANTKIFHSIQNLRPALHLPVAPTQAGL